MRYYEEKISRYDKDGENRVKHKSKSQELSDAQKIDNYGVRTDAFAEEIGYLGVDDLDRLRREELKHQTK